LRWLIYKDIIKAVSKRIKAERERQGLSITQLYRIKEQNKLLLERIEHINEKMDYVMRSKND
jgi:hypothetical protein